MKNSTNSQVLIVSIVAIVAIMAITTAIFSVSRVSIPTRQVNRAGEAAYTTPSTQADTSFTTANQDYTPPTSPALGRHSRRAHKPFSCSFPLPPKSVKGCTDSDGGAQVFFAGNTSSTVTANGFVFHDQCITTSDGKGYLVEYYCNGTNGQVEYSPYPNGHPLSGMVCLNGAITNPEGEPMPVCNLSYNSNSSSSDQYQTEDLACNKGQPLLKTNMTTLIVNSTPDGALIKIDNCSLNGEPSFAPGATPLTVHMPPGTYTLHVAGTGTNWTDVNNLDLGVGETKSLNVQLTQVCFDTVPISTSYSTKKGTVTADGVSKTDECKDDKTLLDYKCTFGPEIRTETEHCKCSDGACAPFVPVNVDSNPEGANVTINDHRILYRPPRQTPAKFMVAPSVEDDPPYVLTLSKEGYETYTESFNLTTEGATFNVILDPESQNQQ